MFQKSFAAIFRCCSRFPQEWSSYIRAALDLHRLQEFRPFQGRDKTFQESTRYFFVRTAMMSLSWIMCLKNSPEYLRRFVSRIVAAPRVHSSVATPGRSKKHIGRLRKMSGEVVGQYYGKTNRTQHYCCILAPTLHLEVRGFCDDGILCPRVNINIGAN